MRQIQALVQPLGTIEDPLALYLHLTDGRTDTMFFERPDGPTLLMTSAALRLECRGQHVRVRALGSEGPGLINAVVEAFEQRLVRSGANEALLTFPRILSAKRQSG